MTIFKKNYYKFVVLFFLYLSQAIPGSFFYMAFPILLREEGAPLKAIGLFNLLSLPMVLQFLWAPFVDRIGSNRFGHYKSWIFPMQLLCVVILLCLSPLDWVADFALVYALGFAYVSAAATQGIGVGGLAVRILSYEERTFGNSINMIGGIIGVMIGSGAMIILYERLGFQLCVVIMCVFLLIPLLLLITFQEPQLDSPPQKQNMKILLKVLKRKGMITWLVLMVFYTGSALIASTMFRPMLIDKGINLETLGLLFGIVTPIIGIVGNMVAPFVINKLGRKNTLVIFGFVVCLQLFGYIFIALDLVGLKMIFAIHGVWGFTGGFSMIVIYSIMMDKSEPATAATDLTVQISVLAAGGMSISAFSGFIATAIGYTGTFFLSMGFTVMAVIFIALFLEGRSLEKATPEKA